MLQHEAYSIPFDKPLHTAAGTVTRRNGIWLRYRSSKSLFFAEAAPLPGFSHDDDTVEQVVSWLQNHRSALHNYLQGGEKLQPDISTVELGNALASLRYLLADGSCTIPASLHYALDTLLLQHWLYGYQRTIAPVKLNALARCKQDALEKIQQGFRTLKIKIAVDEPSELELVKFIRVHHPDIKLRLDANRGWDSHKVQHWLPQFMAQAPEYLEEPTTDLNILRNLNREYPGKIAADERIRSLADALTILEQETADVFVIKPMLCQGLAEVFSIIELLQQHDKKIVFSSALDTGLARRSYALLVSLFLHVNTAHGLATGSLLKFDEWDDTHLIRNAVYYPETRSIKSIYV